MFRRLWGAIAISSLGDWLGLLAMAALAGVLTGDSSLAVQGAAISGVILIRLLPDLVLSPFAGALADRFDRRRTVIIGEIAAGLLYLSVAVSYELIWLYVAQFLIEAIGLFTMPAKQALWVAIVPRNRLAVANQLSLISVYGAVPVAALLFALLNTASRFFADKAPLGAEVAKSLGNVGTPIVIALCFNTLTFLISAVTIFVSRHQLPAYGGERERTAGVFALIKEGVQFMRTNPLMKALYLGILGAFTAGGFVVGVAPLWVITLSAGAAGYSILFGTVFTGLAVGMLAGPRLLPDLARRRLFAFAIGMAGLLMLVMSFMRDFVIAAGLAALVGFFAGIAWIVGYTLIGYEVADRLRGRTFAFVMSSVRIVLLLTVAMGPVLAGLLGTHMLAIGQIEVVLTGAGLTLLLAGLLACAVSAYVTRKVAAGDKGVLRRVARRLFGAAPLGQDEPPTSGYLCVVEGPEPAARRRMAERIASWLSARGLEVVLTGAPEEDAIRRRLAGPDPGSGLADPTRALLSSAAHAEHMSEVVWPALDRGACVVIDGFQDDLQARAAVAGRADLAERTRALRWASGRLVPHLCVVLDDAAAGDTDGPAAAGQLDRLRLALVAIADRRPERYAVVIPEPGRAELPETVLTRLSDGLAAQGMDAVADEPAPARVVP